MRIGILGGTFNPPHLGHLVAAQEAYRELDLDQVMLIPAGIPPHKPVDDEPGPEHRLELCRLAVGDDERFAVSDLELRRDGPSFTVDTLDVLRTQSPSDDLFLILGGDIAAGLPKWHEPERVLELATVAIAERRGTAKAAVQALGSAQGRRAGAVLRDAPDRDLLDDGPPPGPRRAADPLLRPRRRDGVHRKHGLYGPPGGK